VAEDPLGDQLTGWGKVLRIETRGWRSGQPARAAVGYLDDDGSYLVAAGTNEAAWARNLDADGRCTVAIEERRFEATAERLEGPERSRAIAGLILKYGTPAERLGSGPAFRLTPVDPS
jgi:deazaflavin-dependent oxidoreductase (nitroreductase family)